MISYELYCKIRLLHGERGLSFAQIARELHLDPRDGKVQNDAEAMKMWGRTYEKGWAPHL